MGEACRNLLLSCFCCQSLPTCPRVPTSICTKVAYMLLFLTCPILLAVAWQIPEVNKNLPFCKGDNSLLCSHYSSFPATYRICFAYVLFFFLMCVCTIGISSSRNNRSVIHNGFWAQKMMLISCLLVGTAYIPHGLFDTVLMYFGLLGMLSFNVYAMFFYIQLLKGFTFICRAYCLGQSSACTKFIAAFFAVLLHGAGVTISVFLFIIYCNCTINYVFTIVNMCLSHLICLGSLFVKLQKREWNSILSGSVLTAHVMTITWSAISNNPDSYCNPPFDIATGFFEINNSILLFSVNLTVILSAQMYIVSGPNHNPNSVVYVEERGKEICGIWGRRRIRETIQPERSTHPPEGVIYRSTNPNDDEYDHIKYIWYAMHNTFMQAIFYFMLCFTSYYLYSSNPPQLIFANEGAMWFKIVSSWLCMISFLFVEFLPESTSMNPSD